MKQRTAVLRVPDELAVKPEFKTYVWKHMFEAAGLDQTDHKFIEKSSKWEPKTKTWLLKLTWYPAVKNELFGKTEQQV